jgi:hypothetical protein
MREDARWSRSAGNARALAARPWFAAVVGAALFILITTVRLERTGLYYDELHQAVGAFAWVGRPIPMFSLAPVWSRPTFNMSYSGAIKTTVYGLYLRLSGRPFSVVEWRLLGISFGALGIAGVVLLSGPRLPPLTRWVVLAALLTDVNLLLQCRHDWGPVALAFLIRMLLIALWVRWAETLDARRSFALGFLVGLAIFEKLSSSVLLGPLAIMLLYEPRTFRIRRLAAATAGVCVGSAPVIAVNAYWTVVHGSPLALAGFSSEWRSLSEYAFNYLALGSGADERRFMFTEGVDPWIERMEGLLVFGVLVAAWSRAWRHRTREKLARAALACVACYMAIAIALRLLPAATGENHWIIGTPFQYLACAFAAALPAAAPRGVFRRRSLELLLAAMMLVRIPALAATFDAIQRDAYTSLWHPSLNIGARFAASQGDGTVVIAADWGVATQVLCLANGRQDFVFEPFWAYRGPSSLREILAAPNRGLAILAAPIPRSPVGPETTRQILQDMQRLEGWVPVPVNQAVRDLPAMELRAYRRVSGESRAPAIE